MKHSKSGCTSFQSLGGTEKRNLSKGRHSFENPKGKAFRSKKRKQKPKRTKAEMKQHNQKEPNSSNPRMKDIDDK